jgi:hypothetical protein
MKRQGPWVVRTGARGQYRYIGKDGQNSALTLGEAHIFTNFDESCVEADLWTNGHVENRYEDSWRQTS